MSDKWYMMSVVTKKMIFTENVKDSDHFFFFQPSMIDNVQDMIKWIFCWLDLKKQPGFSLIITYCSSIFFLILFGYLFNINKWSKSDSNRFSIYSIIIMIIIITMTIDDDNDHMIMIMMDTGELDGGDTHTIIIIFIHSFYSSICFCCCFWLKYLFSQMSHDRLGY
mgnify:CR=1 FL=1